jgi:hypothetical protein
MATWADIQGQTGLFEGLLKSLGQESLLTPDWYQTFEPNEAGTNPVSGIRYSQPVMDVLSKYQYNLESPQSGYRQYQVIDPNTGKLVYSGDVFKKSNWYDAPLEAAGVLGGMYLGASALNGGLLGLSGTAPAAAAGTTGAAGAAFDPLNAYLTTGGVEGSIAGGAAAGGGAAGAVGIMGPPVAEMAGLLPTVAPTLPAAGMLPGVSGSPAAPPSTPSPLGSAASGLWDFVKNNPSLAGTLLGGLLGGGAGGGGGGGSYDVGNRTPLKPLERPTFTPKQVDYGQGLPGGLGSQSAGLFADYMRRNRGT